MLMNKQKYRMCKYSNKNRNRTVLEPRCDRAAWVRSRFEPQELIDVQLERQLATRYLHDVVFASTKLLYTTSFYQSLGFIAAKYRTEFLFEG